MAIEELHSEEKERMRKAREEFSKQMFN